jgi:thiosulfate/3-mercaptopyruvate sulfurtransferase
MFSDTTALNSGRDGDAVPTALVNTSWLARRMHDPMVRTIEVSGDTLCYASGHIPGAAYLHYEQDLRDPLRRDIIHAEGFAALMMRLGITQKTTVVLYGDDNNRWAAAAFWVFYLYRHADTRLLDGGRQRWQREGRSFTRHSAQFASTQYPSPTVQTAYRAMREDVFACLTQGHYLVDVRSPYVFSGQMVDHTGQPGHIPTALNIPWSVGVQSTGVFEPTMTLRKRILRAHGLKRCSPMVVYSHNGISSALMWFALVFLIGCHDVKLYDGGWQEWGNLVNVPVAIDG